MRVAHVRLVPDDAAVNSGDMHCAAPPHASGQVASLTDTQLVGAASAGMPAPREGRGR